MKRLLLVDDSPMVLAMLSDALRDNYDIVTAASGEEAIAILDQNISQEDGSVDVDYFSIVVTDLRMPGISGLKVASHVKHHYSRYIPVLLLTGEEISKAEALAHGCSSLVSKENSGRVVSMINLLLGGKEEKELLN
jgi:CheY-like chemotaxis protein